MTETDRAGAGQAPTTPEGRHEADHRPPPPSEEAQAAANPALLGIPVFVIGSVALGLYLIGFRGADHAAAGMLPILLLSNGLGLFVSTLWAIRAGQGPVAAIFGIFAAFWLSFPVLVIGLAHGWWAISATDTAAATDAKAVFLLTWFVGIVMLTLASLRLPVVFTLLFVLVDVALAVVYFGVIGGSTGLLFIGGIVVFAFALVGVYLFFDAMTVSLGGRALPMGSPLLSDTRQAHHPT